jgi:hypothetical protein
MLQVTCDICPEYLVNWYNTKTKAIISTEASIEEIKLFSNNEKINSERVLGKLNQKFDVLTKIVDKITKVLKDLRSFTQLDLTLKASEFLTMCSQIRKFTELYESHII